MKKILSAEDFIMLYRAALKVGLSREQFGSFIGMQPQSVTRKRLKIKDKFGTDLDQLESTNESVMDDTLRGDFEQAYRNILGNTKLTNVKEIRQHAKTYVITAAQNATPIHEGFLSSIEKYCKVNDAELLVIPYRYRNPTSLWTEKDHDWWHPRIVKYISDNNIELCKGLQVMGHIKMQPTATMPLSGFDSYTGEDAGIFGHPKVQLKTIPTPSKMLPKMLTTTGAITVANYSDSKAGHKGEFHHSLSAVVVEVTEDEFHMRHIHGEEETGNFYDFEKFYTSSRITAGHKVAALITGDTHVEFLDGEVDKATYLNADSLLNILKPEKLVLHDLIDFYARNHHHRGNDVISVGKHRHGRNNVEEGLQLAADFIDRNTREHMETIIVKSNHDEALDRWLKESEPNYDPENSQFFHYMKYHRLKNVRKTDTGFQTHDPFKFWCHNPDEQDGLMSTNYTRFLKRDESHTVRGIEVGFHGDIGVNGARGSANSLSKTGPKMVIGHSHSPCIHEGVYQVGLSAKLNLEYASGPSGWSHTHCIIYPNGSRTLVHIINGKWRA